MTISKNKKFKYGFLAIWACLIFAWLFWPSSQALQNLRHSTGYSKSEVNPELTPLQVFRHVKVTEIISQQKDEIENGTQVTQQLKLNVLDGAETGQELTASYTGFSSSLKLPALFEVGDKAVAAKVVAGEETFWEVVDHDRSRPVIIIVLAFVIVALVFGRWRGLTSLLGLAFTILIILYYILPHILLGTSPIVVAIVSSFAISAISMFLSHGLNAKTAIAVASTWIALILAVVLSAIAVKWAILSGQTTEDAFHLQSYLRNGINMQGLLLAGMIITTLGLLDDATVGQVVAIEQLHSADPGMTTRKLYSRGLLIGREHIASLINTLMLAYAGTALPLLLLFSVLTAQPIWVLLNSEYVSEEIVRSMVGSIVLILAVPIATSLACWYYKQRKKNPA